MTGPVFTAGQLIANDEALRELRPRARLSVFGDPVAHSKSPEFHNAALRTCGIDAQYVKIHVGPEELTAALRALPQAGFLGTNVTIPHKAGALAEVDEADEYARRSNAVNTVMVKNGKLKGYNTDGPGLLRAIREEFSAEVRDLRVMVLGAGGGAGRAIAVQCAMEKCQRLVLVNRTAGKAETLAAELDAVAVPQEEAALRKALAETDLVINASAVGMKADDLSAVPAHLLRDGLLIYDTVYATGESRLVREGRAAGAKVASGLSMLLHQGALAFEIWFDRAAPVEVMRKALLGQS